MIAPAHLFLATLALFPADVSSFSVVAPSRAAFSVRAMGRPPVSIPSARINLALNDAKEWFEDKEASLGDKLTSWLKGLDNNILNRIVRIENHAPATISLTYFGLMAMNMGGMKSSNLSPLAAALVRPLGETSNAQFSSFFLTKVTPATFVFNVWPMIAVLQFVTLLYSAFRPKEPLLSQTDLTALYMANLASTAWLVVSSNAVAGSLPLASFLILPIVPLVSGYPLRADRTNSDKLTWRNAIYQLYSSFTTVASLLAFAVELQHGGRIPFFCGRGELVSAVFLSMYAMLVGLPGQGAIKRFINAGAICGILAKRMIDGLTRSSILSVSFIFTCAVTIEALLKAFTNENSTL